MRKKEVRNGIIMLIVGILVCLLGFGMVAYYEYLSNTVDSRKLGPVVRIRNIGGILASFGILFIYFGGLFISYGYV